MLDFLTNPVFRRLLGSVVRRALDVVGGFLVAQGLATDADATELAVALTPVLVSLVWSLYQKSQQAKREAVALSLPMGSDAAAVDRVLQAPKP